MKALLISFSIIFIYYSLFSAINCSMLYKWSRVERDETKKCKRRCKHDSGTVPGKRFCLGCASNKNGVPAKCVRVDTSKCRVKKPQISKIVCYDPEICDGCGSYTGKWSDWVQDKTFNCPSADNKCSLYGPTTLYMRKCLATDKYRLVRSECLKKIGLIIDYKCSSRQENDGYSKTMKCPCKKSLSGDYLYDGEFSPWSLWKCTEDCPMDGDVKATRLRKCMQKSADYGPCINEYRETFEDEETDSTPCWNSRLSTAPICKKQWGEWKDWEVCDPKACKIVYQTRRRACEGFGADCSHKAGEASESRACFKVDNKTRTPDYLGVECPDVDGQWGDWGEWTKPTVTCGLVQIASKRLCNRPKQQGYGDYCYGQHIRVRSTDTSTFCPIDGNWGEWTTWFCVATCGIKGPSNRYRDCNNPKPQFNGKECFGNSSETRNFCKQPPCPGQYSGLSARLMALIKTYLNSVLKTYKKNAGESITLNGPIVLFFEIEREFPETIYEWRFDYRKYLSNATDIPGDWEYKNTTLGSRSLKINHLNTDDTGVYLLYATFGNSYVGNYQSVLIDVMTLSVLNVDINSVQEGMQYWGHTFDCKAGLLPQLFENVYSVWIVNQTVVANLSDKGAFVAKYEQKNLRFKKHYGIWTCIVCDSGNMRISRRWTIARINFHVLPEGGFLFLLRQPIFWVFLILSLIGLLVCISFISRIKNKMDSMDAAKDEENLNLYLKAREETPDMRDEYMDEVVEYLNEGGILNESNYIILPKKRWLMTSIHKDKEVSGEENDNSEDNVENNRKVRKKRVTRKTKVRVSKRAVKKSKRKSKRAPSTNEEISTTHLAVSTRSSKKGSRKSSSKSLAV